MLLVKDDQEYLSRLNITTDEPIYVLIYRERGMKKARIASLHYTEDDARAEAEHVEQSMLCTTEIHTLGGLV